ncbi:hypothetical protein TeGR_g7149 [Tetraparma gracilis]|uniref:Citrate synthase n=1 Tax=Tetraparma gracilis TaxID=2962635 RepID=A0ABQ6MCS0_9STRA|nr:hypothetical protein TeGR_g7149 [Tetraparma gracilis]
MLSRLTSSLPRVASALPGSFRSASTLQEVLAAQVPAKQAELLALKKEHGDKVIGQVTVDQLIGGARGIKSMLWETSNLDANEGIRFRGYTIPECQQILPTYSGVAGDGEPTLEAIFWLLLTGEVPTKAQCDSLTAELHKRAEGLPAHVVPLLKSLPKDMHPMTKFSIGLTAAQTNSVFAKKYAEGTPKSTYHEHVLEDILNVVAILPELAAVIYRDTYFDGVVSKDTSLDYSGNFARMLGYNDPAFDELMRLYLVIHTDHEGGNASAHATHLTGSTLSDPYLAYASGLQALAGPLHGLANQEVLGWIQDLQKKFAAEGKEVNKDTITEYYNASGRIGNLRYAYPNVDSHSGVLLWHYGMTQYSYYTVLFGVSRAVGALSQLYWDRALGLPLERPKSHTSAWLKDFCEKQ